MTYSCDKISIHIFAFLCSLLSAWNEYILGFSRTSYLTATTLVSSFIFLMTNSFEL